MYVDLQEKYKIICEEHKTNERNMNNIGQSYKMFIIDFL